MSKLETSENLIMRQYFLEANPNPERIGCPPEEILKDAAEDRLPVTDPARLHMADCSECFAEYRGYRLDWETKRAAKRRFIGWAVAATLLIGIAGGVLAFRHHFGSNEAPEQIAVNRPPPNSSAGLPKQVGPVTPAPKQDESHKPSPNPTPPRRPPSHTSPGEPHPPAPAAENDELVTAFLDLTGNAIPSSPPRARLDAFTLPASNLNLRVILPAASPKGVYTLRLVKDSKGQEVVTSATADAVAKGDLLSLDVKMLLKNTAAGNYYLFVGSNGGEKQNIYDLRIVAAQPPSGIK